MPQAWKTSVAEQDLCDIFLYIGRKNNSPASAERLATVFESTFTLLANSPLLGTPRPDLGDGFRLFSCGTKSNPQGFVIVFKPVEDGALILRIFRSGQAYTELF